MNSRLELESWGGNLTLQAQNIRTLNGFNNLLHSIMPLPIHLQGEPLELLSARIGDDAFPQEDRLNAFHSFLNATRQRHGADEGLSLALLAGALADLPAEEQSIGLNSLRQAMAYVPPENTYRASSVLDYYRNNDLLSVDW